MIKLISISASLLILIQSFNICINDLVNLSELIEHANFHSQKYGDNFIVFISKHYGDLKADHDEKHTEEKTEHEKLPFQHQVHLNSLSAFVVKDFLDIKVLSGIIGIHPKNTFYYQPKYSNFEKEGPFQPPRLI